MTTESVTDEGQGAAQGARTCAYSQCANPVTYDGTGRAGRPRKYCQVGGGPRVWPDKGGKTCQELARAERLAVRDTGLEEIASSYAAYTDAEPAVAEAIDALVVALRAHGALGQRVLEAVDGRVAEAQEAAAAAAARADAAEDRAASAE
ncbi:hypothetical protein, partial [Actinomadura logoneensis]|uniref:hypothetical protein n=1 Tax=Actinomadura logoneensis TaxID=2293572 RepID=UPI0018F166F3